jgi:hypothetical protein
MLIIRTVSAGGRSNHLAIDPLGGKYWLDGSVGIEHREAVILLADGQRDCEGGDRFG